MASPSSSPATIRAGALEVAYDDVGTGPAVVFVHGGLGNRAMWAPQVRALATTFRCLAYDLRGHGATRGGEDADAFTPALLRDDLVAFADALGLARFSVVGLSVGGMVAQELALSHPDRLHRLVLADTWAATVTGDGPRRVARTVTPLVEGVLRVVGTGPLAGLAARGMGASGPEAAELVREATAGTSPETAIRVWRGLGAHDVRDRLAGIAVPTLVIAGGRDRNGDQAREIAGRVRHGELVVIEDAGHISNLHAPERFTAELRRFLSADLDLCSSVQVP